MCQSVPKNYTEIIFSLASIMLIGSMTGAIGGGLQSERYGRRWSLLIDTLIFIVATIAITLAPNLMVVLMSRFVQGHCVASSVVAMPIYTSEISQPEIRKITGVFAIICISFGGFLSMIFGNFCIIHFLKPYLDLYKLISDSRSTFSMETCSWFDLSSPISLLFHSDLNGTRISSMVNV